jgi:protein-S-isoprenylcysteine O-methyltransferase Ste14
MDDQTGFFIILASTLLYGAIHSLLATTWVKARARGLLGPQSDQIYRLAYNAIAGLTIIPVLGLILVWPGSSAYRLEGILAALAIAGQAAAVILLLASLRQSQPLAFIGLQRADSGGGLITTGAYAIVRHPLYITGLCLIWLMPWITTGYLAFCLGATVYILAGSELEERRLIAEYGDAYRAYRRKVARLIPFLF